ncbi:MAG: CoA pyrophosphatase [Saprospiraceae bacterium]|nr:CoA pyrophosphatase [Saprospiraceae bacterium]
MEKRLVKALHDRISAGLPGNKAHHVMAPRSIHSYQNLPSNYNKAAVLALIFKENNDLNLCYIKRTSHHPEDKHAGQISFPGGKLEPHDESLLSCAIRETHEEIGILPQSIQTIGSLSPLYIAASNFHVSPFLAFLEGKPQFSLEKSEVESIIPMKIETLLNPHTKKQTSLKIRDVILNNVPYYQLENEILWGATAMISAEIEALLRDVY